MVDKMQLFSLFCLRATNNIDKVAIIFNNKKITFGKLLQDVYAVRLKLRKYGICNGKTVGIYIEKNPDYIKTILALLGMGVNIVPLSLYYTMEEIESICEKVQINYVITSNKMNVSCHTIQYKQLADVELLEQYEFHGDSTLFLLTSGSTGIPKVSIIPEKTLLRRTEAEFVQFSLSPDDIFCINTPLYHCVGFRMMLTALTKGVTIVLNGNFVPKQWIEIVKMWEPTYTILSPNQIVDLVGFAKDDVQQFKESIASLRIIISTGAKLKRVIKEDFLSLINCNFYDVIGSSETEFIAINKCQVNQSDKLVGKPFDNVEIVISPFGANENGVGEILCRSDMLFDGYWGDNKQTEKSMVNGFFKTGDMGYFDNGELYLVGRVKRIIICSGVNIYPEDIEKAVLEDERITDCYVFGVNNDRCGEVVAIIVAGNGITKDDVKRICLEKVAIYQQPRLVYVVDKIPRNEMGKVPIDIINKDCE